MYFFCVDYRSTCVKNLSVLSFVLKLPPPPPFLSKKTKQKSMCISVDSTRDSDKLQQNQDILHILYGQLFMVQDLILALKADNVEACFILSGISFHSLGPRLDIVSVPKCAVCVFLLANCISLLKL